ncbi:rhomboid family intramembrane serine protease [Porphyromonadaceae sp. NP-X]|nr:rhomboid family intramembrane serine protease [Porphyromonadaceae sp. NP-X]
MTSDSENELEKQRWKFAIFVPLIVCILWILCFALEHGMDWDFHKAGIYPRKLENIWSIFTYTFIHADWRHLMNNALSFFILGICLYYFYSEVANRVLITSAVLSGFILWCIGRESYHIGASGIIYSLAFFLFFSGIIRKHIPLIAISLIVVFIYGSMVWHLFPWLPDDPVSWEGHLSGAVTGIFLAFVYRHRGPQPPKPEWEEEDDNKNEGEDYWEESYDIEQWKEE